LEVGLFMGLGRDEPGVESAAAVETTTTSLVTLTTVETTTTSLVTTTTVDPTAPRIIGTSVQGRPIELYTFGSGDWRVLIIGGVHGDELGGIAAAEFLEYVQEHPEAVPEGAFLQVIPCVNPDGQEAHTRGNVNKVDLNRNLPSQNWASKLDSTDLATRGRTLTGGSSPASEPETKALLTVLDDGWGVVISLHSSGDVIDPDGEGARAIAKRMSYVSGLPIDGMIYQHAVTGSLGVYMPEVYKVPVVTVEVNVPRLSKGVRRALLTALIKE
jgi:protein MpaA